jgi:beta-mannosidase
VTYRPLHAGWTLTSTDGVGPVPATVPGCVHLDLLAAGLIADPYLDGNEAATAWIARTGWIYETTFDWAPDGDRVDLDRVDLDRVDLVCHGLDTVASVTVNGTEVGRTANMHRSYRFDVGGILRAGVNTLTVRFDSPYAYAEALRQQLGDRPNAYPEPFQYIRKMACNFGWDWGPTLVTAGIWQPIGLHSWRGARLAEIRPLITVDGDIGRVEVHAVVEAARPVTLAATIAGQRAETTDSTLALDVPAPRRWWPRGYGDQPRYDLAVELRDGDGAVLDTWTRKVGFRSVRLDTEPGGRFAIEINGTPIWVRGVNWIPDDTFPTRVDRDRYATRLRQACDANVNFVRVWGGGRYESDDFYDLADEMGLLVGQDFLFACAAYPEEEPLASEVAAEARDQVVRLSSHPSLVLWTGNNENIWGYRDWGWPEALAGRTWGLGYYLDLLPRIVADVDPTRPYWPGSPYSGDLSPGEPDRHPNDPAHGTTHIWDVWNTHDYTHYRDYRPRFVAEFGFQAPPAYATLRRASSDEPLTVESSHQKALGGNAKLLRWLESHLPAPKTFDDWLYLTQVNQARAIRLAIEHFRSLNPWCMGAIVWQLNDCWPVTSWSAVDGDGRRKPLWYALRRAYADRLLTIDGSALVAVNDTGQPWAFATVVRRVTLDGEARAEFTADLVVPPGGIQSVPLPAVVCRPEDPLRELLTAGSARYFFAEDRDIAYPPPSYDTSVRPVAGGYLVTIDARVLLRDLALFVDRLDPAGTVDDQLVTLLPGDSVTFRVDTAASIDPAALVRPPVLRCVNDTLR